MRLRYLIIDITAVLVASQSPAMAFTIARPGATIVDVPPNSLPPFEHWDLREFPNCEIPYAINAVGTADFVGEHAQIDNAFQVWEDVQPAFIQYRNVGNTATATIAMDAENVLFWDNNLTSGDPWDPALRGGAVAVTTTFDNAATGVISEADIVFDDQHFAWNAGVQNLRFPPIGDDVIGAGMTVREPAAGGNGVCDTQAIGDDVQMIPVGGAVAAGGVCVGPGADGILQSAPNIGGQADVWVVAAHEIGHFNGLGENTAPGTGAEATETLRDGPFTFGAGATLTFTVNGMPVMVAFPQGQRTPAQVAADIQAAITAQAPGLANATATAGSVRIQAVNANHEIIITGGTAAGVLGFTVGESGITTMIGGRDRRGLTTLDQRTLARDDMDGLNFLYTPDLGDAPDPFAAAFNRYPSLVHGTNRSRMLNRVQLFQPAQGAEHLFGIFGGVATPRYQYEWLGTSEGRIDDNPLECEAQVPDRDRFDDGVNIGLGRRFIPGGAAIPVTVTARTALDIQGRGHTYNDLNRLFLNAWFDWNADGDWDDPGEHVIGAAAGAFPVPVPAPNPPFLVRMPFNVAAPAGAMRGGFARFRLDYREDVGQVAATDPTLMLDKGTAQFGEVEDYPIPFVVPDQLHLIGPTPNQIPLGSTSSINAVVQANFVGIPNEEVVFTNLIGNFTFGSGTVSSNGKEAKLRTDSKGSATMTVIANGVGPAVARVAVTDTVLRAYSKFDVTP